MSDGHEPVVVADGFPLAFLQQEFPSLRFIEFPSYAVYYAAGKSQVGAMLFNLPNIIAGIIREHFWLKDLLQSEHFDQVISDNRFGMWSRRTHSIYMTHQVMVKMPQGLQFLEPLVHRIHKAFINRYDECWIPDREKDGLSGDLSHKYSLTANAKFIGTLSRFQGMVNVEPNMDYEVVAVVSGIEPQRTMFENDLFLRYKDRPEKVLIVCGQPKAERIERQIGNVTLVLHLSDQKMAAALLGAKKIICRSGYSSIMDLDVLNCLHKAELVSTPGQTEQEYLKAIHS